MSAKPSSPSIAQQQAARLLAWYESMGVDMAVQEAPVDWLTQGSRAPGAGFSLAGTDEDSSADSFRRPASAAGGGSAGTAAPTARSPGMSRPAPPSRQFPGRVPSAESGEGVREAVAKARTLDELGALLAKFEGCGLKATAKNTCFYRGAAQAPLMIIGEAPGREEDLEGRPFVGRAGQLLDKMLAAIGMGEANVHITNIVYWRPPGNRTPTAQEALACRPFLERQVALVAPKIVLALGGAAAKQLFDVADGIMRIRGKWRQSEIGGQTFRAMATLHPAYLLRTPAAKGMAWRDLLAVKAALADKS
jgi:DNA polymerase